MKTSIKTWYAKTYPNCNLVNAIQEKSATFGELAINLHGIFVFCDDEYILINRVIDELSNRLGVPIDMLVDRIAFETAIK